MKLSVLVNAKGEIVAATLPSGELTSAPTGHQRTTDELVIPLGHSSHEFMLQGELADAVLDGRFADVFERYVVAHADGNPILSRR